MIYALENCIRTYLTIPNKLTLSTFGALSFNTHFRDTLESQFSGFLFLLFVRENGTTALIDVPVLQKPQPPTVLGS